jgi:hypothetical protein
VIAILEPGSNYAQANLKIEPNFPPTLAGHLIKLEYYITIKVRVKGWCNNFKLSYPITIGNSVPASILNTNAVPTIKN